MKRHYTFGYDPFSKSWIVGIETEIGTIEKPYEFFPTANEAMFRSNELNKRDEYSLFNNSQTLFFSTHI